MHRNSVRSLSRLRRWYADLDFSLIQYIIYTLIGMRILRADSPFGKAFFHWNYKQSYWECLRYWRKCVYEYYDAAWGMFFQCCSQVQNSIAHLLFCLCCFWRSTTPWPGGTCSCLTSISDTCTAATCSTCGQCPRGWTTSSIPLASQVIGFFFLQYTQSYHVWVVLNTVRLR